MILNTAHLHLMLNHAPLFATIVGLVLLMYAWRRRSRAARMGGYVALALSAAAAVFVFSSGSAAGDSLGNVAGVMSGLIVVHEGAAKISLALALCAGALASWAAGVETRVPTLARKLFLATFIFAVVTTLSFGYTALLGGQIHHPEARNAASQ